MNRQNIFEKNETDKGYWRWLVDPVWHHCTSMYHEASLTGQADNQYQRYHHLRACLYFSIGMLEAFFNKEKKELLKDEQINEEEICKELRGNFYQKTMWFFPDGLPENLKNIHTNLMDLNDIRAEMTHPKREDHAIYRELDNACSCAIVETATEFMAGALQELNKPFPYWLLGWNFVGVNNDKTEPFANNNAQFRFALQAMGYRVPASDYGSAIAWEKENMMSLKGFRELKSTLAVYPEDIQPSVEYLQGLPAPRLTRRWWDREFLLDY